jgi:NADPH2:quinone reductase
MKAAFFEATGNPDVIRCADLPTPTAGEGEVLVRVGAASLNPIDTYIRAGAVAMTLPQPCITGCDLAGTVADVGPGVQRFHKGDRVWGSNQGLLGRQGTCAEFACVHEDWLYPTPEGVTDDQAAAAALVGITAHLGLFRNTRLQPGEMVFVHGGTGGVGSMVVQMTRAIGSKVITTVGSADKAELCRRWGADLVLNYKTDDIPARVKEFTQGRGLSVWYETQREPDFDRIIELMAERGRIVLMAGRQARPAFPVGPFYVKGLEMSGFAMFKASAEEQRLCAEDINRWLVEHKLQPVIGRTFPLSETAQAHQFLEENTLGKAGSLTGKVIIRP